MRMKLAFISSIKWIWCMLQYLRSAREGMHFCCAFTLNNLLMYGVKNFSFFFFFFLLLLFTRSFLILLLIKLAIQRFAENAFYESKIFSHFSNYSTKIYFQLVKFLTMLFFIVIVFLQKTRISMRYFFKIEM